MVLAVECVSRVDVNKIELSVFILDFCRFKMNDVERFWSKVNKTEGCWNWTASLNTSGYGQSKLNGKNVLAHRLSYVMNHPNTINLLEGRREICVCHKCDNPKCVNPAHLFLGSKADNMKDMVAKGRMIGNVKLTEDDVREIRTQYATGGITLKKLAREYEVSLEGIHAIIRRRTWKHI